MKQQAWRHDLAAYAARLPAPTRFADVDTRRHVNNIAVYGLHCDARLRWLIGNTGEATEAEADVGTGTGTHSSTCTHPSPSPLWPAGTLRLKPRHSRTEFWLECHYPDPVTAGVRLLDLAFDRATVATGLFQQGLCVGMQQTTLGAWAPDLSTPLPLPAGFAATLSRHVLPAENLPPTGLPSTSLPPDAVKRRFYPVEATFSARYGDFDADGCTSEAAVLRGIEQARAAVLQTAIAAAGGNAEQDWVNLLVARIDLHWAHHRAPPKTWALAGAVLSVGRSSVLLRVAMFDGERLHAMADNVMVYVAPVVATPPAALEPAAELAAAAPTAREPLPPPLRDALQALAWRGR